MSLGKTTDDKPTFYEKTNKNISCSDHGQCLLLLDCPMGDRTQYPWIESGVPCKLLRIRPVALAVVTTDGMQLGDVGDDHLVPVLFQPLRDPDRINTGFHDNSRNGSIDSPLEPQPAPSLHQDSSSRVCMETRWRATC